MCTCSGYFDKGVCKHLVAACIKDKLSLNGLNYFPNKLKTLRRRFTKKNLDTSLYEGITARPRIATIKRDKAKKSFKGKKTLIKM